mgnify:CR=1 FL=1
MDYKEDLKSKLPVLKKIEGFPIGADEDILALSEPPYYTACPNPYIADFIKENGRPYDEASDNYHKEPFVGDVSEGKNDPIYNAHSYHTKVPHKAIMKYIEHYTNAGDVVLDGFCGTGMTGVAAQLLNRKVILSDLSPIATFIAYNYNHLVNTDDFKRKSFQIIDEVEKECGWMYETDFDLSMLQKETQLNIFNQIEEVKPKAKINYIVWSDVFICPFCNAEHIFWYSGVDKLNGKVLDEYPCPECKALLKKRDCKRAISSIFDETLRQEISQSKQLPVLINFTAKVKKKGKWKEEKFSKKPDHNDLELIKTIEKGNIPYWFPSERIMDGDEARRNDKIGITHVHHFYTKRNLWILAKLFDVCTKAGKEYLIVFQSISTSLCTKLSRYNMGNRGNGPVSGTLYISSMTAEANILKLFSGKSSDFLQAFSLIAKSNDSFINCSSTVNLKTITNDSIDYIFTDPPFGSNLMYSELNFLWEAWLKVRTNSQTEAVINQTQHKSLYEYNILMLSSFKEYYRVLKPKRWITVEFHNSSSRVWNGIQDSLSKAGFIIAQVTVLDKMQGSFKQVTAPGSVSNDLVISAFKPESQFENRFLSYAGKNLEFDFIKQFLSQLPIHPCIERTEKMLYSKMLSFYIQHGYEINMDAKAFYKMLNMSFNEIDGLWFTSEQIERYYEYKKKMKLEGIEEIKSGSMFLFVTDEKSALVWLYNFISESKSFSDIHTAFTQLANIQGDAVPELRELLEQNFVFENDKYRRPQNEPEHNQISEKREKALLREFESLLIKAKTEKGKIKLVRKEALLFGFETCYKSRRYQDILTVTSKLDKAIIENSAELNDFVEAAEIMVKGME